MIYECLGNETPNSNASGTANRSGVITSSIFSTVDTIINAINDSKNREMMADTTEQIVQERQTQDRLNAQLNAVAGGIDINQMLMIGGIAAFALIAVVMLKK